MENNFFVTDAEITSYINNSLAELDDIMVTDYEDYKLSLMQASLSNNKNIISIPGDFYKLRGVDFQNTTTNTVQWTTLYEFQLPERNLNNRMLANVLLPYSNLSLTYRLSNVGIIIMPASQCQGIYQIWYTPKFVTLKNLTDTLTIQMDTQAWVEYAVVDCCIKILNKQNLDPSGFLADKAALQQRVRSAAKNRDSAGPKSVANTRYNQDAFFYPFGYYTY
jgi:hypothetical protein